MGKHLRRRFSLQPSFMKDDNADDKPKRDKWVIIIIYRYLKFECMSVQFFSWFCSSFSLSFYFSAVRPLFCLISISSRPVETHLTKKWDKKRISRSNHIKSICVRYISLSFKRISANFMEILQITYSAVHSHFAITIVCFIMHLFMFDWTIWALLKYIQRTRLQHKWKWSCIFSLLPKAIPMKNQPLFFLVLRGASSIRKKKNVTKKREIKKKKIKARTWRDEMNWAEVSKFQITITTINWKSQQSQFLFSQ